jgi:serpin B
MNSILMIKLLIFGICLFLIKEKFFSTPEQEKIPLKEFNDNKNDKDNEMKDDYQKYNNHNILLLEEIFKETSNSKLISTYSILNPILQTFYGSSGKTKKEYETIFKLKKKDITPVPKLFSKYNEISSIDSIWVEKNFKIEDDYKNYITKKFKNEIYDLDLSNLPLQEERLNQWAMKNTKNTIKKLVPKNSLTLDTVLVLANALYFKGTWKEKFEKKSTKTEKFSVINDEGETEKETKAEMMKGMIESLNYKKTKNEEILCLPYQKDEFHMCFIKNQNLKDVKKKVIHFSDQDFPNISNEMIVSIPKFKIEYESSLVEYYKRMGLKEPFTFNANYKHINKNEKIRISDIFHKTFMEVDEGIHF